MDHINTNLRENRRDAIVSDCHVSLRSCLDIYKVFSKQMNSTLLSRTLEGFGLYRSQELLGSNFFYLSAFLNARFRPMDWDKETTNDTLSQRFSLDGSPMWDISDQIHPKKAAVADITALIVLHRNRILHYMEQGVEISEKEMIYSAKGVIKLEEPDNASSSDIDEFVKFLNAESTKTILMNKLEQIGLMRFFK